MGIQCAQCGSHHVQSIKAILQSGTTYSTGSVIGVGAGTDGAGVFSGSSSNTSQTALAARFSPPKKPKKLEMIAGTVMALATSPWLFSKGPLAFFNLAILAWLAWEIHVFMKRNKRYQEDYPKWKALHDNGFFCHRCGTTFASR